MEQELKKMYDSEINVQISSFWDGGWRIALGDELNGYIHPEYDIIEEVEDIIPSLQELILKHLPDSTYAKNLRSA